MLFSCEETFALRSELVGQVPGASGCQDSSDFWTVGAIAEAIATRNGTEQRVGVPFIDLAP